MSDGSRTSSSSAEGISTAVKDFRVATADSGDIEDADIVVLLRRVREILAMDVIFVGEFTDRQQVLHLTDSEYEEDRKIDGLATDLSETYCQLMVQSRVPRSVPDVSKVDLLAALPATQGLGIASYLSVPVTMADGQLYGTLCCLSHATQPELGYRQERSLDEVAQLIAEIVERNRLLRMRRQAKGRNSN